MPSTWSWLSFRFLCAFSVFGPMASVQQNVCFWDGTVGGSQFETIAWRRDSTPPIDDKHSTALQRLPLTLGTHSHIFNEVFCALLDPGRDFQTAAGTMYETRNEGPKGYELPDGAVGGYQRASHSCAFCRRPGYVSFLGVQMLQWAKHPTFFAIRFPKIKILQKYLFICALGNRGASRHLNGHFFLASESM